MRILLLGKNGQLGWELHRTLAPLGEVTPLGPEQLDLSKPEGIGAILSAARPDVIVNAAAYTAVDRAETDRDLSHAINARAPGVIAEESRRLGAYLVHYSTDYIFDGRKQGAYLETDPANPLNVYGESKLAGERAIAHSGCEYVVLRTSWVYGARGNNFLLTIQRLAATRNELRIVDDQHGAPNWSRALAEATAAMLAYGLRRERPTGIYHLSSRGQTSWHGFTKAILEKLGLERTVVPIRTDEYPLPAKRPANSVLDTTKLERDLGLLLPDWQQALDLCVADVLQSR